MLPVADPDGLGECQALRSERLLGQLEAVERRIVRAKPDSRTAPAARISRGSSRSHPGCGGGARALSRLTPMAPTQSSIQTSNGWRRIPPTNSRRPRELRPRSRRSRYARTGFPCTAMNRLRGNIALPSGRRQAGRRCRLRRTRRPDGPSASSRRSWGVAEVVPPTGHGFASGPQ